jgi:hypothetical protein|tara:strand:- start:1347 stop:1538 length:192 start_codon:yes stop_codon:yes gene_type:complete
VYHLAQPTREHIVRLVHRQIIREHPDEGLTTQTLKLRIETKCRLELLSLFKPTREMLYTVLEE